VGRQAPIARGFPAMRGKSLRIAFEFIYGILYGWNVEPAVFFEVETWHCSEIKRLVLVF
jgi:hypothetical protein